MTTDTTTEVTLVDLVREWRDAKLAIRASWDESQGKGFNVTTNMMKRRVNAEAALLAYAKGLPT